MNFKKCQLLTFDALLIPFTRQEDALWRYSYREERTKWEQSTVVRDELRIKQEASGKACLYDGQRHRKNTGKTLFSKERWTKENHGKWKNGLWVIEFWRRTTLVWALSFILCRSTFRNIVSSCWDIHLIQVGQIQRGYS